MLVLTEFRPVPGKALLSALRPLNYQVTEASPDSTGVNTVCVLSVEPHRVVKSKSTPRSSHRWVEVYLPGSDLRVLGVHVPNQTEVWDKRDFWVGIEAFARVRRDRRTVILGDLNTALDEDCEGDPIREAVYLKRMVATGWVDAWRQANLDKREFSWYSHRNNGFRLDHCLVSPTLSPAVSSARYRHDVRGEGLSDHSLLCVELSVNESCVFAGHDD